MPIRVSIFLACLLAAFAGGCGQGTSTPQTQPTSQNPPAVSISISPTSATVVAKATQQFSATVSNSSNTTVNWQVNGVAGGSSAAGTISTAGLYTAPASVPSPAAVTVQAVSAADSSMTASATVTVTAPPAVAVTVTPAAASVVVNGTQQFSATVSNATDTTVTWQVNGVNGGALASGVISNSGLYSAPASIPNPATVTVTAISNQDSTKSGSATVTLTNPAAIAISISPSSANLNVNATQQFTATVTNATDTTVAWQVNGVAGGNSTVGVVSGSGLYVAPATVPNPATVTVKAIANADHSTSATATVTIAAVSAGNRFLYVGNVPDNQISIFAVDDSTGLLTPAGSASTSGQAFWLSIHPTGKFLYAMNKNLNSVDAFSINATTGALTAIGAATATGTGPGQMAITPDGKFLYVAADDSTVSQYSINLTTGALSVLASPLKVSAGRSSEIGIASNGKWAYVADRDSSLIVGLNIGATGALSLMGSSVGAGTKPGSVAVDPSSHFVVVGNRDDSTVQSYSINQTTGSLTSVGVFPAGPMIEVGLFKPNSASSTFLYGLNELSNSVAGYSLNLSTGALAALPNAPYTTGTLPVGGVLHPNGKFVYVTNAVTETAIAPGTVSIYSVAADGSLTLLSSPSTGNNPVGIAITP